VRFRSRLFRWSKVAAAILLGLAFNIRLAVTSRAGWGVDFNQFYSASQLAGTGHLYEWDALRKIESFHGIEVPTGRLPVVLYGHKILGILPYRMAHSVWIVLSVAALLVFAFVWPGTRRSLLMVALAWSTPVAFVILFGHDTPFWLMFFAVGLVLLQREKPWSAGVAFSLCICKFHLALGIPVMLAAQKRWKPLIAGAVSVLLLLGLCFLIEGVQWPLRYSEMSQMPSFSPATGVMPTISAFTDRLPWALPVEVLVAVAILLLLWMICRVTVDIGIAGAAASACGLLVGHHALFADSALLIPLAVVTIQQNVPRWLKALGVLLISPAPFALGSVLHKPLVWQIWIAPFVVAALVARVIQAHQENTSEPILATPLAPYPGSDKL